MKGKERVPLNITGKEEEEINHMSPRVSTVSKSCTSLGAVCQEHTLQKPKLMSNYRRLNPSVSRATAHMITYFHSNSHPDW